MDLPYNQVHLSRVTAQILKIQACLHQQPQANADTGLLRMPSPRMRPITTPLVAASGLPLQMFEKKVLILCHRLVILDQLQNALGARSRVRTLAVSDKGKAFEDYDILLSTSMRAKEVLEDAIPKADLIIVDEAHRVSPNGRGYRRIIEKFREEGKPTANFMGLTASPERRTGDQRDQLSLAFDAIIDCVDIQELISERILVKPKYRPHFVHDLDLAQCGTASQAPRGYHSWINSGPSIQC